MSITSLVERAVFKVQKKIIRWIVWDFDGTLFQSSELGKKYEIEYFNLYKNFSGKKNIQIQEFREEARKFQSWSKFIAIKFIKPEFYILDTIEKKINITNYAKRNGKILEMVLKLSNYKHIILSNCSKKLIELVLPRLGLSKNPLINGPFFEKIIDRNVARCLKPDKRFFALIKSYTKDLSFRHLIIGDSLHHDIIPARESGYLALHIDQLNQFIEA